jgi:4-hydroxy-tetrahydrodipicolinate synthase
MEPKTIVELYNMCDNIKAIKEASGSIDQVINIKLGCNIKIFSGDDALLLPLMSIGAVGVISVVSNLIPNYMAHLVERLNTTNWKGCKEKFFEIHSLIKNLFCDTNPIPLKYLLYKLNVIGSQNVRLPLINIQSNEIMNKLDNYCNFIQKNNQKDQKKIKHKVT